jgi:hypothetical protein
MRAIWERNLCMRRKLFGSGSPDWYDLGNLESGTRQVIDNQDEVERLLRELTKALPLSALATPALMANLREQSSTANITLDCTSHQGPPTQRFDRRSRRLQPERPKHPVQYTKE